MAEKKRISVNVDHGEPGFFTDNVTISHNPHKFIFDFTQVTPRFDRIGSGVQQTLAVKHKTIIMDPIMVKNLFEILENNLQKYEKNFGKIKIPEGKNKNKSVEYSEEVARYIG